MSAVTRTRGFLTLLAFAGLLATVIACAATPAGPAMENSTVRGAWADQWTDSQSSLTYRVYVPIVAKDGPPPTPTPEPEPTGSLTIHFIDVGQGDATLIDLNGERLLIDGGRSRSLILDRLATLGISDLDAIVATHPDADHIAGLISVLEAYPVERIYVNGGYNDTQTYADFEDAVVNEGASVETVTRGDTIPLGGLQLDIWNPPPTSLGENNEDSIVVQVSCGSVDVLITGDSEALAEQSMLASGVVEDIDVLRVGHHGSRSSTTQAWVEATDPEYAVISAGLDNQYGHPHPEVVQRLEAYGATILYTDTSAGNDTITMTSDCQTFDFNVSVPPPGTPVPTTPPAQPTPTPTLPPVQPTPTPTNPPSGGNCHPSYPDICIPPPPPDLNCGDIPYRRFTVVGSDPHRFDGDNDGVGCES